MTTGDWALLGLAGVSLVLALVIWVLYIIGFWKVFQKAGQPGWKSIIPLYNIYIEYKISWSGLAFLAMIVVAVVQACLKPSGTDVATGIQAAEIAILGLVGAIIHIIQCYKMSKAFGKGMGYCLGLIFLNPIFVMILGYGSATYQGPQA